MNVNKISSAVARFKKNSDEKVKQNQLVYLRTIDIIPSEINKEIYNNVELNKDFVLLRESVKREGILQPLLVVPHNTYYSKFEIVAGHRRHMAATIEKIEMCPCIVANRDNVDDIDLQISLITTNLLVRERTPAERAKEIEMLEPLLKQKKWDNIEQFKGVTTRQMLSEATGLSERSIADYQNINKNLSDKEKEDFAKGVININDAKRIIKDRRKIKKADNPKKSLINATKSNVSLDSATSSNNHLHNDTNSNIKSKDDACSNSKLKLINFLSEIIKNITTAANKKYVLGEKELSMILDIKKIIEGSELIE
ncbi:MAG: ParB/RepB/Spo0J family partition protein [Saccharofermentanales bacterium]|jgi:ParB/RepB/Spo0J family partition protein